MAASFLQARLWLIDGINIARAQVGFQVQQHNKPMSVPLRLDHTQSIKL